jgi:hypothetical protein
MARRAFHLRVGRACPVCSAIIRSRRAEEVRQAVEAHGPVKWDALRDVPGGRARVLEGVERSSVPADFARCASVAALAVTINPG